MSSRYSRWHENPWACALLIVLLSLAVYINSLTGGFIWDDVPQVLKNPFIKHLGNIPYFFTVDLGRYTGYPGFSPYYRPLFLVSYAIDYSVWGLNSFGYHLTNVVLHTLCSLLVYAIAVRALEERPPAFFAAAIFAAHPVHSEAVAWIAGRADLLAAFFVFSSFCLYAIFRDQKRKLFLGLSLLAFVLSILSKEAAISLPLLLLAYELSQTREEHHEIVARKFLWPILYIITCGLYFILRASVMGSNVLGHPDAPRLSPGRIYATPGIVVDYLRLFLFPLNLRVQESHCDDSRIC